MNCLNSNDLGGDAVAMMGLPIRRTSNRNVLTEAQCLQHLLDPKEAHHHYVFLNSLPGDVLVDVGSLP